MKHDNRKHRLTNRTAADARPGTTEYTLWDRSLNHFGLRVYPTGVRSFIVQIRVNGRLRKFTLGRYPATGTFEARRRGAQLLARIWAGEPPAPVRKARVPLFRDFAARYRNQRKARWKPSSVETYDIYMRNRLMPQFGRLRLDAIDHACVSAWFDAASADKPGAANRAYDILRAMLNTARQWGDLGDSVPDACAHIVRNTSKPVARYLNREELNRPGAALDRHEATEAWPVAAIRLLILTGGRHFGSGVRRDPDIASRPDTCLHFTFHQWNCSIHALHDPTIRSQNVVYCAVKPQRPNRSSRPASVVSARPRAGAFRRAPTGSRAPWSR